MGVVLLWKAAIITVIYIMPDCSTLVEHAMPCQTCVYELAGITLIKSYGSFDFYLQGTDFEVLMIISIIYLEMTPALCYLI